MPYQIETEADNIIKIIKQKGSISVDELSKQTKIKKKDLENTLQLLEQLGFIKVDYKLTNTFVSVNPKQKADSEQDTDEDIEKDSNSSDFDLSFGHIPNDEESFFSGAGSQLERFFSLETTVDSFFLKTLVRSLISGIYKEVYPKEARNLKDKQALRLCEKVNKRISKLIYSVADRQFLDFISTTDLFIEAFLELYDNAKPSLSEETDRAFNNIIRASVLFKFWGFRRKAFIIQLNDIKESIRNKDLLKTKEHTEKAISLLNTNKIYKVNPISAGEAAEYIRSLRDLYSSQPAQGFSDESLEFLIPFLEEIESYYEKFREAQKVKESKIKKKEDEPEGQDEGNWDGFDEVLSRERAPGDSISSLASAIKNLKEASLESQPSAKPEEKSLTPEMPKQAFKSPKESEKEKSESGRTAQKPQPKPESPIVKKQGLKPKSQLPSVDRPQQKTQEHKLESQPPKKQDSKAGSLQGFAGEAVKEKPDSVKAYSRPAPTEPKQAGEQVAPLPSVDSLNIQKKRKEEREHYLLKRLSLILVESERLFSEDKLNEALEKIEKIKKACKVLSESFHSNKAIELGKKASGLEEKVVVKYLKDNQDMFLSVFSTVKKELDALDNIIASKQFDEFIERYQKVKKVIFQIPDLFPQQKQFFKHKLLGILVRFQIAETKAIREEEKANVAKFTRLSAVLQGCLKEGKVEKALEIYDAITKLAASMQTSKAKLNMLSDSNSLYARLLAALEKKTNLNREAFASYLLSQLEHIDELFSQGEIHDAHESLRKFFQAYSSMPFLPKDKSDKIKQKVFQIQNSRSKNYFSDSIKKEPEGLQNVS
jgi:DNA-binding MarR family transcriptional regulator